MNSFFNATIRQPCFFRVNRLSSSCWSVYFFINFIENTLADIARIKLSNKKFFLSLKLSFFFINKIKRLNLIFFQVDRNIISSWCPETETCRIASSSRQRIGPWPDSRSDLNPSGKPRSSLFRPPTRSWDWSPTTEMEHLRIGYELKMIWVCEFFNEE